MMKSLLFLFSIILSFSSFAKGLECPAELTFKDYYFVFEGADGYCPRSVEFWKTNISLNIDLKEINRKNCLLASGLQAHFKSLKKEIPKNVLYYSWTHVNRANECAESLKKLALESGNEVQISVMGFSFGGFSAIRFTRKLIEEGITPKRLFTVDPVAYNLRVLKSLFGNTNPVYEKSFHGVEWDNIYQNQDRISLKITGIDGMSIPNASHNEKIIISEEVFKEKFDGKIGGHIHIPSSSEVIEGMKDFFSL